MDRCWSGRDRQRSTVADWGSNFSGALGDGTTKDSNVPIQAAVPLGFAEAIGTGFDHACAIVQDRSTSYSGSAVTMTLTA